MRFIKVRHPKRVVLLHFFGIMLAEILNILETKATSIHLVLFES